MKMAFLSTINTFFYNRTYICLFHRKIQNGFSVRIGSSASQHIAMLKLFGYRYGTSRHKCFSCAIPFYYLHRYPVVFMIAFCLILYLLIIGP